MTRTRNRLAIGAVLLVSAALVATASATARAHAEPAAPTGGASGAAPSSAAPSRMVVLPTGERLVVRSAGGRVTVSPAPGARAVPLDVVRSGSHVYALPRSVAPALARLDLGLFDVASGSPSRSVRITFTGTAGAVPGVRIITRAGTTASGTITDPTAFSAALTDGAPGVVRIATTTTTPPSATPAYPMSTLTIHVTDLPPAAGRLLAALVTAENLDDLRRADLSTITGADGTARLSVPDGHYVLWALVLTDPTGGTGRHYRTARIPVRTDVTVDGATQATLDPNQATVHTSFALPRSTALLDVETSLLVSDGVRSTGLYSTQGTDETNTLYQPSAPAPVGRVGFIESETRATGTRTPDPVQYDVGWEWADHVPTDPGRTVASDELTPVTDRFYGIGTDVSIGLSRTLEDTGVLFTPGSFNQHPEVHSYVYGPDGADWVAAAYESPAGSDATIFTVQLPRPIPRGVPTTVDWSHGQLAPAVTDRATWPHPQCTAARTDTDMVLSFLSGNDDPNQQSVDYGDGPGERVSVTEDGTTLTPENPVLYPVHAGTHAYAVTVTENRARLGFSSSTYTTSRWNFQASAADGPRVPAAWQCAGGPWTVLPMLTLHAAIPIAPDATMPATRVRVPISVGHTAAAARTPIARVRMSISTDGTSWTAVPVTAAGPRWAATLDLTHLPPGTVVSVRTEATDQTGSTLQQTTTDAFTVGGTA